jgi:ribosomal protein S18 acetylase RimI-like enzyme
MTVRLRPMREDEFPAYVERGKRRYADDMVENGGLDRTSADEKSASDWDRLFPGGRPGENQFVFAVEDETGTRVGDVWFAHRPSQVRDDVAFLYSIEIDPAYRGRGFGRGAMEAFEAEVRSRGLGRIELNVFGGNDVARSLYRTLGYAENAVWMGKDL